LFMEDTIAAIATGTGKSAIGIIRISGPCAFQAVRRVFAPVGGWDSAKNKPRTMIYGTLFDKSGHAVDRCMCVLFPGPGSYTGEDCAELHCHGSPTVLSLGLESLFRTGVRQAHPGEFTRRAFLNGRMDLSQAEAVADLIDSVSPPAARNSVLQLGGALRNKLEAVYKDILGVVSHFQAMVDYPEEDIDPFDTENACSVLGDASKELERLADSYARGRVLKEGVLTAIIGRPNAGKSSLLNALLGYERAIVTSEAGTTRDSIEEPLLLGGVLLRLTDTAGIRDSRSETERLGISRSLDIASRAGLVYAVFDGSRELGPEDDETVSASLAAPNRIAVLNKSDLPQKIGTEKIQKQFEFVCSVSALSGEGLDRLAGLTGELLGRSSQDYAEGEILTNLRQAEAAKEACRCLRGALAALRSGLTADAALCDAEAALEHIGAITGSSLRDDIAEEIFSRFCVGK